VTAAEVTLSNGLRFANIREGFNSDLAYDMAYAFMVFISISVTVDGATAHAYRDELKSKLVPVDGSLSEERVDEGEEDEECANSDSELPPPQAFERQGPMSREPLTDRWGGLTFLLLDVLAEHFPLTFEHIPIYWAKLRLQGIGLQLGSDYSVLRQDHSALLDPAASGTLAALAVEVETVPAMQLDPAEETWCVDGTESVCRLHLQGTRFPPPAEWKPPPSSNDDDETLAYYVAALAAAVDAEWQAAVREGIASAGLDHGGEGSPDGAAPVVHTAAPPKKYVSVSVLSFSVCPQLT
jgi:hypothetical protein